MNSSLKFTIIGISIFVVVVLGSLLIYRYREEIKEFDKKTDDIFKYAPTAKKETANMEN